MDNRVMQWDIFCRVIDNYGDIGVCWRVSADLAGRGHRVRLWIDDSNALTWMAPGALQETVENIQILPWSSACDAQFVARLSPADVWIEAFGCEIAPEFIAAYAMNTGASGTNSSNFPVWINLEYLTAEPFAERAHALPSPFMSGPGRGATKYFYYPGFTRKTGGLLREPALIPALAIFARTDHTAWLNRLGVDWQGERLVSLFCYEPTALPQLISTLANLPTQSQLLVTSGRANRAVRTLFPHLHEEFQPTATCQSAQHGNLKITFLPLLTQTDYDRLLWCCDLNFVRGEDSVIRALWAGKPLVWQIYPQEDGAHLAKLDAFLRTINAPPTLRAFHQVWNDAAAPDGALEVDDFFSPQQWHLWTDAIQAVCEKLVRQADLVTQLIEFVEKKR
jgi:uncharacterized repeat protein (TIGR03837 family)